MFLLVTITILFNSINSLPLNDLYNPENYKEVYDQRQNGSANYRINLSGVVLLYAPPESLLGVATLLSDPGLLDGGSEEYENLEEVVIQEKPQNVSNVTTSTPTSTSPENIDNAIQMKQEIVKRKFRLPGFMRPFVRRHDRIL